MVFSKEERANMTALYDSPRPYFYLYLHIIHDLGVLIPLTLFETEVLVSTIYALSKIMPHRWSVIWGFESICLELKVSLNLVMSFSLYGDKTSTKGDWMTLSALYGITLLKPHFNHYNN